MKTFTLFTFFAVLILAAIAGPLGTVHHNPSRNNNGVQNKIKLVTIHKLHLRSATLHDWLTDLIDELTGSDAGTLIGRINEVITDLDKLVLEAETELTEIISSVSEEIQVEIQNVIDEALAEAKVLLQPIVAQLKKLMPAITAQSTLNPNDLSSIIKALLGKTLEEFLENIGFSFDKIDNLLKTTTTRLQSIASSVSQSVANKIQTLIKDTLHKGEACIKPLLDILGQIFDLNEPNKQFRRHGHHLRGHNRQTKNPVDDLMYIIYLLTGVDVAAIVNQFERTVTGVELALVVATTDLETAFNSADTVIQQQVDTIVTSALVEAQQIVKPLSDILAPLFPPESRSLVGRQGYRATPIEYFLNELIQILLGVTLEQLKTTVETTVIQLQNLLDETVLEVQTLTNEVSTELSDQVNHIVETLNTELANQIEPLLKILAPLFPPPTKTKKL